MQAGVLLSVCLDSLCVLASQNSGWSVLKQDTKTVRELCCWYRVGHFVAKFLIRN